MRSYILITSLIFVTTFTACKKKSFMNFDISILPPIADKIPFQLKEHNDLRVDDYFWFKERDNPEVVDYLERENDYLKKMTTSSQSFQKNLFEELKSRMKEDDESVPYFYNDYWYIIRFVKGQQYPIYTRKKKSLEAKEEILFDCNKMAKEYDYFRLVGLNVSPDNSKVVYGVDLESRRKYTIYVKDLNSGQILPTKIENTTGGSAWASDSEHFFYVYKNPETLRSESILRHNIKHPENINVLVFNEKDETFSVYVSESKSTEYIYISSYSTLTTETQFIKSDMPLSPFQVIQTRIRGLEYSVDHFEDHFYILSNKNKALNFELSKTLTSKTSINQWETILAHREDVLIEDIEIFKEYWVVTERFNGLTQIRIMRWDGTEDYYLPIKGETYDLYGGYNPNFDSTKLRYGYTSLTTPNSLFEYDMVKKTSTLLKQSKIMDQNFDPNNYVEKRIWSTSRDGLKVPISIVHHKDTSPSAETPFLLYSYGSYGSTVDPSFSSSRLSLLNRGFVFGIAHVRGGEYLGRQWYEDGKLLKKKNTFNDFIDCSKYLIKENYTSASHLHAVGGSAGGLLMGVIVNEAPELYKSVIAAVPFVDVVTTMLDDTIPLTTGEFDEWGNPNNKEYYDYMKSYSPYDNIKVQAYPNLLVTAGFHDSQVQYWEPAKWVAKLRTLKTDNNVLFLDTNMEAGHSGASGRFDALKDVAKEYTFMLQLEGKVD